MATTVKQWLESLLLEQYLSILENSGYDTLQKCAHLNTSDLDRIGVTMPGHKLRLLKHLPTTGGQVADMVPEKSGPPPPPACKTPDQVYDIPVSGRDSHIAMAEEIYQNMPSTPESHVDPLLNLPPKMKPIGDKNLDFLDEAAPGKPDPLQAPTKRPVPQPRASVRKKPVPKPRASANKSPTPCGASHPIDALNESVEEADTSKEEPDSCQPTSEAPAKPPRKFSLKLTDATESETDVDRRPLCMSLKNKETTGRSEQLGDNRVNEQHHNAPKPNVDSNQSTPLDSSFECKIAQETEHLSNFPNNDHDGHANAQHTAEHITTNSPTPEPGVGVYLLEQNVPEHSKPTSALLSPEDLDFFENLTAAAPQPGKIMHPAELDDKSDDPAKASASRDSHVSFDDPIYDISNTGKNDMFNDELSFTEDAPIPRSMDEWDEATVRQSLMVGMKLPSFEQHHKTDQVDTDEDIMETLPAVTDIRTPPKPHNKPCDVNKNVVDWTGKKSVPEAPTTVSMVSEEEDNALNETKLKEQATSGSDPAYQDVWNMKSGEVKNVSELSPSAWEVSDSGPASPDSEDMQPPHFAPPPLPSQVSLKSASAHALLNRQLPPKPANHAPPPPPLRTNISVDSPKPPAPKREEFLENRPLPEIPAAMDVIRRPAPALPSPGSNPPALPQRNSQVQTFVAPRHSAIPNDYLTFGEHTTSSDHNVEPAVIRRKPAQVESREARPIPPVPTAIDTAEPLIPSRPAPPTPGQTSKSSPPLLVKKEKLPPLMMMTDKSKRDTFTDLAFDRVSSFRKPAEKPMTSVQETAPSLSGTPPLSPNMPHMAPPPPPRKPGNLFSAHRDDISKGSFSEDEYPASPSVYDDVQSDDTLSDGGDWFDGLDFKKPSKEVLKEAVRIIPPVQHKSAKKTGYLFKRSSQETIRRMGGIWTKRWVELDEACLKYYSSRKRDVTKRIIPIASMLNIEQDMKVGDSHPYQFRVITVDRIYTFCTEDSDDLTWWSNMLMWAIIDSKEDFDEGGEMHSPDKEGFIKMEDIKGKRYFVLKNNQLCYYNTLNDFKAGSPIAKIEMKLSAIKDLGKNRLQIITPSFAKILVMDSTEEFQKWKTTLEDAIADGLGDDSVLNEVYENHSNRFCADCGASGPQWASVNLAITLCKHCAGIHRNLTLPMSKVRSLRMDFKVWKPALKKIMRAIGNDNANAFWEWHLRQEDTLDADADMSTREGHITLKYRNKRYCRLHPLNGDQNALNEALHKSVQYGDLLETMQLFFTGADILSHGPNDQTSLQLAQNAKQDLQVEFLYQNGAEGSGQMPITTSMVLDHMMIGGSMFIHHKGYLYKTGSNVKEAMQGIQNSIRGSDRTGVFDFLKRWCVLERGELAYYENEKSAVPKNKLERMEMLSVTSTCDPRFEFAFELATTRNGRVFLFAAELEEDRRKWLTMLAKSMAPVPQELAAHIRDFDRAGILFMKAGSNGSWNKCWMQKKDRKLYYHVKGLHDFELIDLRKVRSVNLLPHSTESCKDVYEDGPSFTMSLYKDITRTYTSLYIQGDITKETETWFKLVYGAIQISGDTVDRQPLTADDVPVIVDECINFVSLHGIRMQGIYRLNGQHSKITKLLEEFHKDARDVTLRQEEHNVHDVATALKRYFRSLEDPLLTASLYPKWLNTASIQDHSVKLQWYQYLIKELPPVNHATLKKLVLHLCRVADLESENKMGSTNIASIFGPILMRVDKDEDAGTGYATTSQEIAVFKDLLDSHLKVFEVRDQEIELEEKMEKARKRMEEALKNSPELAKSMTQEMLIPIYFHSADNQVYTIKVTASMTAEDLLQQMKPKLTLQPDKQYAIYECICNEELERPLHYMEKVLSVILRWADWPKDLCKDNKLRVKENYVYENVQLVFDPHSSLFGELKFSDKKGFKKYCFEFSQMKMSYKKDSRATTYMCSWNIEDLTVYMGVQQKRGPPTLWGFSFVKDDEKVQGPMFGHSVCCNTKEELYRWLAAILHGQSPMGLKPGGRSPPDGASLQDDAVAPVPLDVSLSSVSTSSNVSTSSTRSRKSRPSFINRLMRR